MFLQVDIIQEDGGKKIVCQFKPGFRIRHIYPANPDLLNTDPLENNKISKRGKFISNTFNIRNPELGRRVVQQNKETFFG